MVIPVHLESGTRRRRGQPAGAAADQREPERRRGDLLCARCERRITHEDLRIEVAGNHLHTFVNPGGYVHRLGCFAAATGLAETGPTETAFSWFPGYSWQIVACGGCTAHLGWIYRCAGEQFFGLLVSARRTA